MPSVLVSQRSAGGRSRVVEGTVAPPPSQLREDKSVPLAVGGTYTRAPSQFNKGQLEALRSAK